MPIIKSAIKRVRQTKSRTKRNNAFKRTLKDAQRQLDSALASNSKKDLPKLLSSYQSKLDMAVKKNLMHKNTAARTKQRYSSLVKATGAKPGSNTAKSSVKSKKPAKKTATKSSKKS